jgi:hypothetical protein
VVAVAHGFAPQGSQVRPGVRLGEPLAPDLVPAQHRRQVPGLLLGGPEGHDGGGDVRDPDGVDGSGRVGGRQLLGVRDLLEDPGVAPTPGPWPARCSVAGVSERGVPLPEASEVIRIGRAVEPESPVAVRQVIRQPGPQLGPVGVGGDDGVGVEAHRLRS